MKNVLKCIFLLVLLGQPMYGNTELKLKLDGTKYAKGEWRVIERTHGPEGYQEKVSSFPGGALLEKDFSFDDSHFTVSELFFVSNAEGGGWMDQLHLFITDKNPNHLQVSITAEDKELSFSAKPASKKNARAALDRFYEHYNGLLKQLWHKEVSFSTTEQVNAYFNELEGKINAEYKLGKDVKEFLEFTALVKAMEVSRRSGVGLFEPSQDMQEVLKKFDSPYFHFIYEAPQVLEQITNSMVPKADSGIRQLDNTIDFLNTHFSREKVRRRMTDYYFGSFISDYSNRNPAVFEEDLKALTQIAGKLNHEADAQKWLEKFQEIRYTFKGSTVPDITFMDLEGKDLKFRDLFDGENYVYIDFWATWCVPCIKEFPFLEQLEEKYHGKNIRFISISVDATEEIWRKRGISKYGLDGEQYHDKEAKVLDVLQIQSIPRFLLYDPQGNWISMNAPRPSDDALPELLNSLLK